MKRRPTCDPPPSSSSSTAVSPVASRSILSVTVLIILLFSMATTTDAFRILPHNHPVRPPPPLRGDDSSLRLPHRSIGGRNGRGLVAFSTTTSSPGTTKEVKRTPPSSSVSPPPPRPASRTEPAAQPQQQQQQQQQQHQQHQQQSARLLKAKRLLNEFQMDAGVTYDRTISPSSSSSPSSAVVVTTSEAAAAASAPSINGAAPNVNDLSRTFNGAVDRVDEYDTMVGAGTSITYSANAERLQASGYRWASGAKVAEPLIKYDPVAAERLLFRQPGRWIRRNVQIAFPLALWVGGVVFDIVRGVEFENRRNRARQLLKTLTGLGPAIIKGGQALASRPDLMPGEYLEELQKLQDDVPTYENDLAFAIVREELGRDFDDVFELVQGEPVAAASIGQVYKARLVSNGDLVAIKIQRPNCEKIIALDLYVLRWWSGVANVVTSALNRDINVQSIIDDFGELIYRELDYVAEAANAQRFTELYAGVPDVFVPKVYSELTTSKVLTMEWIDGMRLTDPSLEEYGLDRKKLVDTLVQCSLRQILENGFFHADPHAGNLLACEDGRLCYLDFGMMSYAEAAQRNGFLLAVVHIVNRDWGELVRLYVRLGFIPEGTDLEPIEIGLEKALPDVLNSDVGEVNFKNVVNQLGDIMYTYPFSLPPFYIAIIRCLGVLEGLAIQVDPNARVIAQAYPYVASRVLTDSQDDFQEALRRLALTSDGQVRWGRLEGLLDKAKESRGYDVTAALDQLSDYLLSVDGEILINELADEIVEAADSLSGETVKYLVDASRAVAINDEVAAVRAFKSLQAIFARREEGIDAVRQELSDDLRGVLPKPTPAMVRFFKIASLLGAQGSRSDPAKYLPLIRKLSQEPRIQRVASEIIARLGERFLSRSLRAAFGLSEPVFKGGTSKISSSV